jgi:hypothetical protein
VDMGPRKTRRSRRKEKSEDEEEETNKENGEKEKKSFAGEIVKKWQTRSRTKDGVLGKSAVAITCTVTKTYLNVYTVSSDDEEAAGEQVLSTEWWGDKVTKDDHYNLELGGKLILLAEVLKMAAAIGDKVYGIHTSLRFDL